jgi:hypothetical protein
VRRILSLLIVIAVLASVAGSAYAVTYGPVKNNPADSASLLKLPIEPYQYDYAKKCRKSPAKGALAMVDWLQKNAKGSFWGIMRCEKWGKGSASLHAEGRAIDWHLSVHNAADRAEAQRLIHLLLATDKDGNVHALARRMGVQEIIWNCTAWFSGDGGMKPYSACYDKKGKRIKIDDTTAHRDHIHFGLNWAGAKLRTSFWSRR